MSSLEVWLQPAFNISSSVALEYRCNVKKRFASSKKTFFFSKTGDVERPFCSPSQTSPFKACKHEGDLNVHEHANATISCYIWTCGHGLPLSYV